MISFLSYDRVLKSRGSLFRVHVETLACKGSVPTFLSRLLTNTFGLCHWVLKDSPEFLVSDWAMSVCPLISCLYFTICPQTVHNLTSCLYFQLKMSSPQRCHQKKSSGMEACGTHLAPRPSWWGKERGLRLWGSPSSAFSSSPHPLPTHLRPPLPSKQEVG